MGIFALRARQAPPARPETRVELPGDLLTALPSGFVAVGEALVSGASAVDACAVTGRELSLEGVSLDEALQGLEVTSRLVRGTPPDFGDTRALSLGWSEATLGYLHRLTCADPATGLASLALLQSRLTELYRGQAPGAARLPAPMRSSSSTPSSPTVPTGTTPPTRSSPTCGPPGSPRPSAACSAGGRSWAGSTGTGSSC